MARVRKVGQLAAVGSTGNNTHTSVAVPVDADALSLEFEITAVGGTPTVTFKFQGSQDDGGTADSGSDWFDLFPTPTDGTAAAISYTKTAVGVYEYALELARQPVTKVRAVVSANTNVTYESELWSSVDV